MPTFAAWLVGYKRMLLEGPEVWLVVVSSSLHSQAWTRNGIAAVVALLAVFVAGLAVRATVRLVPESTIKLVVGAKIVSFGTYWTPEALAGEGSGRLGIGASCRLRSFSWREGGRWLCVAVCVRQGMGAFVKTLFGDAWNMAGVGIIVAAAAGLTELGHPGWAVIACRPRGWRWLAGWRGIKF